MPKNNHGDPEGRLGGPPVDLNLPAAPGATEDVTGEGEDMPAQEAAAAALRHAWRPNHPVESMASEGRWDGPELAEDGSEQVTAGTPIPEP
jgi:hypothetical protein